MKYLIIFILTAILITQLVIVSQLGYQNIIMMEEPTQGGFYQCGR